MKIKLEKSTLLMLVGIAFDYVPKVRKLLTKKLQARKSDKSDQAGA